MTQIITIFCAGLIGWDTIGRTTKNIKAGEDLPGNIETNLGGVIANIAIALSDYQQNKLDIEIVILSSVGNDEKSNLLISTLNKHSRINCDNIIRDKGSTDGYVAIESRQGLFGAVASSVQLEKACKKIFEPITKKKSLYSINPSNHFLIIDSNLTTKTINYLTLDPSFKSTRFVIACASPFKAKKIRNLLIKRQCIIYANLEEASEILGDNLNCSSKAAELLFKLGAEEAIVTNGKKKVSSRSRYGLATYIPNSIAPSKVTGAGDTFLASHFLSKLTNIDFSEQKHLEIANSTTEKKIIGIEPNKSLMENTDV